MSELAPDTTASNPTHQQVARFELIKTQFELDPNGPLCSAIWDFDIDIHDLSHRRHRSEADIKKNPDAKVKPVITTGNELIRELFIQIHFMQSSDQLQEMEAGKNALIQTHETGDDYTDMLLFDALDRLIRTHHTIKPLLQRATDMYYSERFWANPDQKSGLNTDELVLLYDYTAPFENQGLIAAVHSIRVSGEFENEIMFESDRIARLMVALETGDIDSD